MQWLPKSRIRYNSTTLDPILASAFHGYKYFGEWEHLDKDQQAILLAAYRAKKTMDAYQAHEASGSKK
jgi:hypothetical protein